MKTSKLKSILTFILLAAVTFTACKKDDPAPKSTIEGSWAGKYGSGNSEPVSAYNFNILPNGILQATTTEKVVVGVGTWKLEAGAFYGIYTYNNSNYTYNLAGKYNQAANTISGSWGKGQTDPSEGKFILNKQ